MTVDYKDMNRGDMMDNERILEIMGSGAMSMIDEFNIPNDPRIDIAQLTADDDDPKFVNVEVIRTGISKTNRRAYNDPVVEQISRMIPGTLGYLGHPDPSKTSFEFREPQCIFVGKHYEKLPNGGSRAIGKAYLFKSSPLREWIPKSIIGGSPLTVSINGTGDIARDTINNLIHVQSMSQLDSIDWANPGTEGVGTAQAISVVKEMQNSGGGNGKMGDPIIKTPEIIRSITIAEMKAYNGDVINEVIKGMTIAELQTVNPNLHQSIVESGKITEMQLSVDGKQTMIKLTDVQGLIDARDGKIKEMQNAVETAKITEYKNTKLADIPEQFRDKVAKRVTGKTEAEIDASIKAETDYIKEMMGDAGWDNVPKGNGSRKTDVEMATAVKNMFGVKESK